MKRRNISHVLAEALGDTAVVFLRGARQTGKTTLVRDTGESVFGRRRYITLDSPLALTAATDDPVGFLSANDGKLTIDEAQRAPELMLAVKAEVDRLREPGRFLLTGSANVLSLPKVADSLAGRMEILTLEPLSQGEINGVREDFISRLFSPIFEPTGAHEQYSRRRILEAACAGGYPEALTRAKGRRRDAWFESYVTTLLERDVRDIASIHDLGSLLRLVSLLAARSATLFNQSEISRSSGIPMSTLGRYIALLEAIFLVAPLHAWSANIGKRLVKSPKLHIADSGLAAYLCGASADSLGGDPLTAGRLVETFVVGEIRKQRGWTEHPARLYHYRTHGGEEIDLILEDRAGRIAAVEVKASESITTNDAKPISKLRDELGDRFVRGAVVYAGGEFIPIGDRVFAVPMGELFAAR